MKTGECNLSRKQVINQHGMTLIVPQKSKNVISSCLSVFPGQNSRKPQMFDGALIL